MKTKETRNEGNVGQILFGFGMLLVGLIFIAAGSGDPETVTESWKKANYIDHRNINTTPDYTLGDAVEAITESDMFSKHKTGACSLLLPGAPSEYYHGVMGISKSDMFSINKYEAIGRLTEIYKKRGY